MQKKHIGHKETDITAVLVISFILLVAILIAKVANDFTKQTTSTQTKAAEKALKYEFYTDTDICAMKSSYLNPDTGKFYKPSTIRVRYGTKGFNGADLCKTNNNEVQAWVGVVMSKNNYIPHTLRCCIDSKSYTDLGTTACNDYPEIYIKDPANPNAFIVAQPKPIGACMAACDQSYPNRLYHNFSLDPNLKDIKAASRCKLSKMVKGLYVKETGTCCFQ